MSNDKHEDEHGIALKKSADSDENIADVSDNSVEQEHTDTAGNGKPQYHPEHPDDPTEEDRQKDRDFRKKLNREARAAVSDSLHHKVKLIVHRPEHGTKDQEEYHRLSRELLPVIREIAKKTLPLLVHETSVDFARHQYYGNKFQADSVAYQDYRYFAKKLPPAESPSLVVGLRVDESASMAAFGRVEAAKRAVLAVYEFCQLCQVPIVIYGDTADVSKLEQMSIYAYTDFGRFDPYDRFRLMGIRPRSNNRDGMALRIIADRLIAAPQQTKLLISISDGQPKAMDDYTGQRAIADMQQTISAFERKGVTFLAAAIGQDKEVIQQIYGSERFLDITNLAELPAKLVRLIARYL